MVKRDKIILNRELEKADKMREECDNLGLPHIGVEFTNITHNLEKLIKRISKNDRRK